MSLGKVSACVQSDVRVLKDTDNHIKLPIKRYFLF